MIVLTIKEICELCAFAGIEVDKSKSIFADDPEQIETEITISKTEKPNEEGYSTDHYAFFTEYPEEGCYPLGDKINDGK